MRVAFVGWGAVSRRAASLVDKQIEIVAVATRQKIAKDDLPAGAQSIVELQELGASRPELVVEAASQSAVEPWAMAAFECGADFIVSSLSAFADASVLNRLVETAKTKDCQLEVHAGALGAIDALSAAKLAGLDKVEHRIIKPPTAWFGTEAEKLCDLRAIKQPVEFFSDSATTTAKMFPQNANVAMTTALAGLGPDLTRVVLVADPNATTNRHELTAHGTFGSLRLEISNKPLADNPKSSALTAYSLARCINNRLTRLII